MADLKLKTSIEEIPRIGPVFQKKLKKMGIRTVWDLLFHFPLRYEDFSNIKPIAKTKDKEKNCLAGKILQIKTSRTWKKRMFLTEAVVEDKSGAVRAVWFNQPYLTNVLKQGDWVCLAGKAATDKNGIYLSSPVYEKISPNKEQTHTGRIIPVYPETAGLSSRWLRYILYPLLKEFRDKIPEPLPWQILREQKLMPLSRAIWQVHFPDSLSLARQAKNRFSFEELFLIELAVLKQRLKLNKQKSPAIPLNLKLIKKFVGSLPFKLTDSQRKCGWQIFKDMEQTRPMSRLLQGDVGSGKTVVAIMAGLNTAKAGWQVAFMAPTEILAKQHFKEVSRLLRPFKIRIALLTGKEDKIVSQKLAGELIEISRRKLLEKAREGEIDLLIGTHALIQDKVKFGKLGLCIVDEQHRFGVEQRAKLIQNSKSTLEGAQPGSKIQNYYIPHLLSMTATPIPRSLALTIYGDLDLSILDEMPKGRKKIITEIVPPNKREEVYDFVRQRIRAKEQAFVICPRIEAQNSKFKTEKPSSWSDVKAVEEEYEKLSKKVFPEFKTTMLHGKMRPKEKEKIMNDFKNKKFDILVSTSVVEVGIDIPKATIMLIEGADRFGLAQLHQFRGRVGRSDLQSYCFLFTDSRAKKTQARLKAILKAKDGFELAEKDLRIRGPGSLFGAKQWGLPDLAMENLKNLSLVERTREAAKEILRTDPDLKSYPLLNSRLTEFSSNIHLE